MTTRISKFTYGVIGNLSYDPSDPEHVRRMDRTYVNAMGDRRVPDGFEIMLLRVRDAQPLLGILD